MIENRVAAGERVGLIENHAPDAAADVPCRRDRDQSPHCGGKEGGDGLLHPRPPSGLPPRGEGCAWVSHVIAVEKKAETVYYIHGHLPVFHHAEKDVRGFRMLLRWKRRRRRSITSTATYRSSTTRRRMCVGFACYCGGKEGGDGLLHPRPPIGLPPRGEGCAWVSHVIAVEKKAETVYYIHGHLSVFHHAEKDVRGFRMLLRWKRRRRRSITSTA